jgi:hypothetical protein
VKNVVYLELMIDFPKTIPEIIGQQIGICDCMCNQICGAFRQINQEPQKKLCLSVLPVLIKMAAYS